MRVSKDAALFHVLKLLDESRAQAIEQAKETDPVVRQLFRFLDPNNVDLPEPISNLADQITEQLTAEYDRHCELANLFTLTPEGLLLSGDKPTTARLTESIPVAKGENQFDFDDELLLDDGADTNATDWPKPTSWIVHGYTLYLTCAANDAPFGLVRVIATKGGVPLASTLRMMEFQPADKPADETWQLRLPLADIFGGTTITGVFEIMPIVATEINWMLFPQSDIEKLVNTIPQTWVRELQAVIAFVEFLRTKNR